MPDFYASQGLAMLLNLLVRHSAMWLVSLGLLLMSVVTMAQSALVLRPTDHCRDFSAAAVVTFADADLEEVIREALGLDTQAELTCSIASQLTELRVPTQIQRVVYGGTLRPSPAQPFSSLAGIQNLTGLTQLNIINRLVTDISPLSELSQLRILNLHTNWITDISPLSELTNLTSLIISENPIVDISSLSGLVNLQRLQVHGLYPYQLQYYLSLDDGRDPDVVFNGVSDISALSNLTELRYLRIHLQDISDISPLAGLEKLTNLRIYDNKIADINPLENLTALNLLWVHDNLISDLSPLAGMTEMVQLGLSDNSITDIEALGSMSKLQYLFLRNNRISDLSPLRRSPDLAVLHLDNNAITDISALQSLPALRELGLANNPMLYDVQPLLQNQGIGSGDELDLRFTHVPCEAIEMLEQRGVNLLRVTALNGSACAGRRLEDI